MVWRLLNINADTRANTIMGGSHMILHYLPHAKIKIFSQGMNKKLCLGITAFVALVLFSAQASLSMAALMGDYCQVPPNVGTVIPPNIMFVFDDSSSMVEQAYAKDKNGDKDMAYNPATNYEGYFTPEKFYVNNGSETAPFYEETTDPPQVCTYALPRVCQSADNGNNCFKDTSRHGDSTTCSGSKKWNCATSKTCFTDTVHTSGNFLNYVYMSRVDLARWAVTGGTPASCDDPNDGPEYCNPYEWSSVSGSGKVNSVCDATGCTLLATYKPNGTFMDGYFFNPAGYGASFTDAQNNCRTITPFSGTWGSSNYVNYPCYSKTSNVSTLKIRVPWSRINESLAMEFSSLAVTPRMGGIIFGGPGSGTKAVLDSVYVGDFTQSQSTTSPFPFMNWFTMINRMDTSATVRYTPTGPALWDTFAYFKQATAPYTDGFAVQANAGDSGNYWKNPLYTCPSGGGSNCIGIPCVKNYVILLSDGQWNSGGGTGSSPSMSPTCQIESTLPTWSADPVVAAYTMHQGFLNGSTDTSVSGLYAIGMFVDGNCSSTTSRICNKDNECPAGERCIGAPLALKNIAMYGSFAYNSSTQQYPGNKTGLPSSSNSCTVNPIPAGCGSSTLKGSSCAALPPSSPDWDKDGDGEPDTYAKADDAGQIKTTIMNAVYDILNKVSSGTAASVLASGEGSGANLIQAVFYPSFTAGTSRILWTGELQNFWYYIDPFFTYSTIREDTDHNKKLNLGSDRIAQFFYDSSSSPQKTRAKLFDSNPDGTPASATPSAIVDIEDAGNLWEAGKMLRDRNLDTTQRKIYTTLTGAYNSLIDFSTVSSTNLNLTNPLFTAPNLIKWVKGYDIPQDSDGDGVNDYRLRTTSIDGTISNNGTNVWKLGDIVNSTARIASWVPLNLYDKVYGDTTYTAYTASSGYKGRGMVLVGANDGMLHAFKMGKLEFPTSSGNTCTFGTGDLACLANPASGSSMGNEAWAFIPKNVLPYLQYLADPNYCHIYSVDLSPFVFDASINGSEDADKTANSWRTIVIGGMRTGGACKDPSSTCTDCVKTPLSNTGYSSYFALDITDTLADPEGAPPKLLWEYSNAAMGFATSGPQVIRIGDRNKNGNWYVAFGSGPTGPLSGAPDYRFYARSDQALQLFVLDLRTGNLVATLPTGISNAFAGTMYTGGIDTDLDYQDDAFYVGYVKQNGTTWNDGGVLRVLTRNSTPGSWEVSTFMDGIGPVTTSIAKLQNVKTSDLWIYFATGRYYYIGDDPGPTSRTDTSIRQLYGVKDKCFTSSGFKPSCPSVGSLDDVTTTQVDSVDNGWHIRLEAGDSGNTGYYAERSVTNPAALLSGVVYFTTYKPGKDLCSVGGKPFFWGVKYKTGGNAGALLTGKALIQISTGAIEQIDLATAFTQEGNRRADVQFAAGDTGGPGGQPGGDAPPLFSTHEPLKRIIHMRER